MSNTESKGLSSSFAESIVENVIKPSYKSQLEKGISDQLSWKKWSNKLDISSHFFSAGTTFVASYGIYSGNSICQYITVGLAVLTQLCKGLSSYSSSEEMKTGQSNTVITSQILGAIANKNDSEPSNNDAVSQAANDPTSQNNNDINLNISN
jgi:hypothetical protein